MSMFVLFFNFDEVQTCLIKKCYDMKIRAYEICELVRDYVNGRKFYFRFIEACIQAAWSQQDYSFMVKIM
jgi:hypothetical protein